MDSRHGNLFADRLNNHLSSLLLSQVHSQLISQHSDPRNRHRNLVDDRLSNPQCNRRLSRGDGLPLSRHVNRCGDHLASQAPYHQVNRLLNLAPSIFLIREQYKLTQFPLV